MLHLRKKLLLSTAIIVGVSQFGFIASADPVDEGQVRHASIAPVGPISQEQVANLKQASATMQKSVKSSNVTSENGSRLHSMQDDLLRLNDLSANLDKGSSRFLDFSVNDQDKLEQEGWKVKGFTGLGKQKSEFGDCAGVVAYNRDKNVITVVYNETGDNAEMSASKQYSSTKEQVLSMLKDITSSMSDEKKKKVKVIVSAGSSQAAKVGSVALADLTENHGKELFGEKFDNKKSSTFYGQLDQAVDTKQYRATEAEFVKTAQELEEAKARGQNVAQLQEEFAELGQSLHTQAQQGAQVELMAEELELQKSTVHKTSFKEEIKEGLEKTKQTLKSMFLKKDTREELNVLCLDGGGVRGIGTLLMLVDLEMRTGKKVHQLFDRIYGTSTGGLMAIMLARGMAATEVLDIYFNNMDKIFYRSWSDTFLNPAGLMSATYNPEGLEGIIHKYVGDASLKDVKIPVAVTCVDKRTQKVKLLSSDSEKTKDVSMLDAGRATSAAPTYFPAKEVTMKHKKIIAVDGGVGANNPSEEALNDIKKKFGDQYKVNLVSLGTGVEGKVEIHDQAGKLGFGSPANIPAYFMGTNERNIEKRIRQSQKRGELNEYNRFNFALPFAIDLADTSELAKTSLLQLAYQRTQQDDFKELVKNIRDKQR